jgi:hypothetical protein
MPALTAKQTYEFDVRGYFTLPGLISTADVGQMNGLINLHHERHGVDPLQFTVMDVDRIFWELMTNETVLGIARHLCGDHFRVDHVYGLQRSATGKAEDMPENLHGGPRANQGSFFYQWHGGKAMVGLLVFGFVLEPVRPGDGGLIMVPGSHKGSMPLEGLDVWNSVVNRSHASPLCDQPVLAAGDAIVFTESLVHGTRRWQSPGRRRRNLYYKYCPGHLCWRAYDEWAGPMHERARTDVERSLLRPPFVASYTDDEVTKSGDNRWRAPTLAGPSRSLEA